MIEQAAMVLYRVWLLILTPSLNKGGYCTQRRQVLVPGSLLLIKPLNVRDSNCNLSFL